MEGKMKKVSLRLTLRRFLRKKIADEVVFRRFQGEGVEFF